MITSGHSVTILIMFTLKAGRFTSIALYINSLFIMASLNPAKIIGLDEQIGSIEKGKLADLVFVDDKFNVLGVMSEGEFYE